MKTPWVSLVVALGLAGCGSSTHSSGVNDDGFDPLDDGQQYPDGDELDDPYGGLDFPTPVATPTVEASGFGRIVAGHDFTCMLTDTGAVKCWGLLPGGEDSAPVEIAGLTDVTALAAGPHGEHACALAAGGTVSCFGRNDEGQLGDGTDDGSATPVAVAGLTGATSIAAGNGHSCAVTGGTVKCWGGGSGSAPADVAGVPASVAVAAGGDHSCALATDGTVWCWGSNGSGQLGRSGGGGEPQMVAGLTGATGIAAGQANTCATTASGMFCWGANGFGQLGIGTDDDVAAATPSKATGAATSLSSGTEAACAVIGGGAKCWGHNDDGQLGIGTDDDRMLEPMDVSGLTTGVEAIAAGDDHACALMTGGAVKCWGENTNDQLGGGSTADNERAPVDVVF